MWVAPQELLTQAEAALGRPLLFWVRPTLLPRPVMRSAFSTADEHQLGSAQERGRQKLVVGRNARENGFLWCRLRRPGTYPGLEGNYRRPDVFRAFHFDAFCRLRS
jgi:hypothetical protein